MVALAFFRRRNHQVSLVKKEEQAMRFTRPAWLTPRILFSRHEFGATNGSDRRQGCGSTPLGCGPGRPAWLTPRILFSRHEFGATNGSDRRQGCGSTPLGCGPGRPASFLDSLATWKSLLPTIVLAVFVSCITATRAATVSASDGQPTVLKIEGTQFTLNGKPAFLLGISYYGALGAPQDWVRRDLDDMERYGFNWLRVWATWDMFDHDVSAVAADGKPRKRFLTKLKWLVAECDRRGLVVDVTLTRSAERIATLDAHQRAVEVIVQRLRPHRNWYLDLANERDVRDSRYVSVADLKKLRDLVRRLDPPRLVTASFGGHDLSEQDVRESLLAIGLDFISPHRPRHPGSPTQTEARTREWLALAKTLDRPAPVHYQEPFRRGYGRWEPTARRFFERPARRDRRRRRGLVLSQRCPAYYARQPPPPFV